MVLHFELLHASLACPAPPRPAPPRGLRAAGTMSTLERLQQRLSPRAADAVLLPSLAQLELELSCQ